MQNIASLAAVSQRHASTTVSSNNDRLLDFVHCETKHTHTSRTHTHTHFTHTSRTHVHTLHTHFTHTRTHTYRCANKLYAWCYNSKNLSYNKNCHHVSL